MASTFVYAVSAMKKVKIYGIIISLIIYLSLYHLKFNKMIMLSVIVYTANIIKYTNIPIQIFSTLKNRPPSEVRMLFDLWKVNGMIL